MLDANNQEIHIGDIVLRASTGHNKGIQWSKHRVIGFTPCMLKVIPFRWNDELRGYSLIVPENCIVIERNLMNER